MKNKNVIFIDCGDTLVDEDTQVFDCDGIVTCAEFYDGAETLLKKLKENGYTVILVADGLEASFKNIFNKIGFWDKFDGRVISENVGALKPDAAMFQTAFNLLPDELRNKENIVMAGNNLRRDIKGANNFGITSVWMNYSPRYFHKFEEPDWIPDYEVHSPDGLWELLRG